MPHWAGESVGAVKTTQSAAEIVREVYDESEKILAGFASTDLC